MSLEVQAYPRTQKHEETLQLLRDVLLDRLAHLYYTPRARAETNVYLERKEGMMPNPIVHIELVATDPAKSAQFYGDVFGWSLQHDEKFSYHMFSAEPGPGGGFVQAGESMGMENKVNEPLIYIGTDDIDATLEQIEAHGGGRVLPKTEIPGIGWFAVFLDPAGNRMALYTQLSPERQTSLE